MNPRRKLHFINHIKKFASLFSCGQEGTPVALCITANLNKPLTEDTQRSWSESSGLTKFCNDFIDIPSLHNHHHHHLLRFHYSSKKRTRLLDEVVERFCVPGSDAATQKDGNWRDYTRHNRVVEYMQPLARNNEGPTFPQEAQSALSVLVASLLQLQSNLLSRWTPRYLYSSTTSPSSTILHPTLS